MKLKKTILKTVSALLVCAVLFGAFLVYRDHTKIFDFNEKSSIAMGTVVTQKIYGENTKKHISAVTGFIVALENLISWRDENSAVYELNEKGVVTDSNLSDYIRECVKLSEKTKGRFDITVGGVSQLWSIGESDERVPDKKEITAEMKNVGYKNIELDRERIFLRNGSKIDLGAVGKGIACDIIRNYLEATDVKGAVVSVGGSILVYGSRDKAGSDWSVAIQHPRKENEFLGVIHLKEGFISTSGDYERFFIKDSKRYHHILDGTTGYPSDSGLISVTVVCDNGLLSDALSTACFILGKDEGMKLLEEYGASGIFVTEDEQVHTVGEIDFER